MKSLPNKPMKLDDQVVKTSEFITDILHLPVESGLSYQDLKDRQRLEKVVRSSKGSINLEDADWNALKKIMDAQKWSKYNADILELLETLKTK